MWPEGLGKLKNSKLKSALTRTHFHSVDEVKLNGCERESALMG
jgi:hypothetical protein